MAARGGCKAVVADKWSMRVVTALGAGPRRFTDLKRGLDGISQRMLTVTLRQLERDGLVSRTVYPVVPPRVDYALTPLGESVVDGPLHALGAWVSEHGDELSGAPRP
jgi:DNA-binding HxlR family transcriptional regulator